MDINNPNKRKEGNRRKQLTQRFDCIPLAKVIAFHPLKDHRGEWMECNPKEYPGKFISRCIFFLVAN
jgi:hypothetical protein